MNLSTENLNEKPNKKAHQKVRFNENVEIHLIESN